jgi:ribosome biogenesis GTPase
MPEKKKGVKGHQRRQGLGRLRRANTQDPTRVGGLERLDEDDEVFDRLGTRSGSSHGGETLLARFNRVARSPASAPGEPGEVVGFAGATVLVRAADGRELACTVRQALKKQIAGVKNPLCVGDRVRYEAAPDGGAIAGIEPRRNQLERADSHNRSLIHVFAANLDCLAIIASLGSPELKLGLIDRYLVIAAANGIPAAVVINKADLGDAAPALELYRGLGYAAFATVAPAGERDAGVAELRAHLAGKACVVAGQSGVGKSSLINALYPDIGARVGAIADAGHGRHTTTSARGYPLPGGGRLIDTPGVRECAITGLRPLDVALLYPDIAAQQPKCRFTDCTHLHEPDCAVEAAVEAGAIAPSRYLSYVSIATEDLAASS